MSLRGGSFSRRSNLPPPRRNLSRGRSRLSGDCFGLSFDCARPALAPLRMNAKGADCVIVMVIFQRNVLVWGRDSSSPLGETGEGSFSKNKQSDPRQVALCCSPVRTSLLQNDLSPIHQRLEVHQRHLPFVHRFVAARTK